MFVFRFAVTFLVALFPALIMNSCFLFLKGCPRMRRNVRQVVLILVVMIGALEVKIPCFLHHRGSLGQFGRR